MLSILFGSLSALTWGAADFTGGLASRKASAFRTVFFAELVGLIFLLSVILFYREPVPALWVWLACAAAGAIGTISLMLLFQAMAQGKMSIAAPVSALLAAIVPVVAGSLTEGLPGLTKVGGFGCALAAVWLVSIEDGTIRSHLEQLSDLRLPLIAGLGFGSYFVIMHYTVQNSTVWPMVASRSGGVLLMLIFIALKRESLKVPTAAWPFIITNGLLDVGGNLFFILSTQAGRMDIAAVLSSLYPGATVILAWLILKEHISRSQTLGILIALAAIVLMTV